LYSVPFSKKLPKPISLNDSIREIALTDHDEQQQFNEIMRKYQHIFSDSPGKIKDFECQIQVTPDESIYQKPYPIPMSKAIRVDQEIQRMLDLGIIKHSSSP